MTLEAAAGVVDGDDPLPARLGGGGILQLQQMLDQALDLAEQRIPLGLPQTSTSSAR